MRALTDDEQRAIEQLGTAFRGVKHGLWTGSRINAAPSRHDYIAELRKKSEGAWSAEEIDWLYFKAATTVGDDETVKYVFVRFVELLLRDEAMLGSVSTEIIVRKLEYAHFTDWPKPQREATLNVLRALLAYWRGSAFWSVEVMDKVEAFVARHS